MGSFRSWFSSRPREDILSRIHDNHEIVAGSSASLSGLYGSSSDSGTEADDESGVQTFSPPKTVSWVKPRRRPKRALTLNAHQKSFWTLHSNVDSNKSISIKKTFQSRRHSMGTAVPLRPSSKMFNIYDRVPWQVNDGCNRSNCVKGWQRPWVGEILGFTLVCVISLHGLTQHSGQNPLSFYQFFLTYTLGATTLYAGILTGEVLATNCGKIWIYLEHRGLAWLIYPKLLPVLVSMAVSASTNTMSAAVNMCLGVASLWDEPRYHDHMNREALATIYWLASILMTSSVFWSGKLTDSELGGELISLIFPIYRYLVDVVSCITQQSLNFTEMQLTTTAMINVLIFGDSLPMKVLKVLVWVGGGLVAVLAARPLKILMEISQISRWKFRPSRPRMLKEFWPLRRLAYILMKKFGYDRDRNIVGTTSESEFNGQDDNETGKFPPDGGGWNKNGSFPWWYFLVPALSGLPGLPTKRYIMQFKSNQVEDLKIFCTAYIYLVLCFTIFGPIRWFIAQTALNGDDPFIWSFSYLLGLPRQSDNTCHKVAWILINADYTRIYVFLGCAYITIAGLLAQCFIASRPRVPFSNDTRRKMFHGLTVIVFLVFPSSYLDAQLISLAFATVLGGFLCMEIIRSGQLCPFSWSINRFLQVYVDHRDIRGPIVISPMFLLIGCAVPFWLSLATGNLYVERTDISLLAGVISLGLGDSMASLVGHRYGSIKWPWNKKKSIQGSTAMMIFCLLGLISSQFWLFELNQACSACINCSRFTLTLPWLSWQKLRSFIIASGLTSFMEVVTTQVNDNILIPIFFWLMLISSFG